MSTASHTSVLRGPGTSTAFTNEPCSKLTANTVYQVTDAAKRLLDPAIALTVQVDADGAGAGGYVTADPSTYTVDYLHGRITFLADQGASAVVRVSGNYLPTVAIAGVTEVSYTAQRDVLDDTTINNADGVRTKRLGLGDCSGSFTLLELLTYDHDPGAGSLKLQDYFDGATPLLLEKETGGKKFRAWVLLEALEEGGAVADLLNHTVNFTGAARKAGAGYAWEP